MRHFTDFSEHSMGSSPEDWSERWVVGGQELEVIDRADATGGRALEHRILVPDRRAWSWDVPSGSSTVDIVTRMRADRPGARFGLIGRGAGEGTIRDQQDGFTVELESGDPDMRSRGYDRRRSRTPERPHGTGHGADESSVGWRPDTWYWMRLNLQDGAGGVDLRAKVWSGAAEDEPADWQHVADGVDPNDVGADGWMGITGQHIEGVRHFDVFGVGTNGDTAPTGPM